MTIKMKAADIRSKARARNTPDGDEFRFGIEESMGTGGPLEVELPDGSHLTFAEFESFEKWLDAIQPEVAPLNGPQQRLREYLNDHQELQARLNTRNPGFIVFAGGTGTGKSTALGIALRRYCELNQDGRVVQLGDGTENANIGVLGEAKIEQTEDAMTWARLRLGADVVAVGEIRDGKSSRLVLELLEAGHNVMASVHAHSSDHSLHWIERMVAMDPPDYLADDEFDDWQEAQIERWDHQKRYCLAVSMPDLAAL